MILLAVVGGTPDIGDGVLSAVWDINCIPSFVSVGPLKSIDVCCYSNKQFENKCASLGLADQYQLLTCCCFCDGDTDGPAVPAVVLLLLNGISILDKIIRLFV